MSSKQKGAKDKKTDQDSQLQKLCQQQKRQILQQTFTIKKLQDRLSRLTQQNYDIVSTKDKFHAEYEDQLDKNRILIDSHQNTIKQKSDKIYSLEVQKISLTNRVKNLQRQLRQLQALRVREFEEYKKIAQNQIQKMEIQLKQFNFYMNQRQNMQQQNNLLKKTIQQQKQSKVKQVADKQRQKVQATDKLRDEMLTKIRDMRSNLLSLKKQQLSTTTRLAVLQNHQLTSQLQFQSKQSQRLIFENEHLQKKVTNLQKDLQIHKQIQQQLAKRSHYSRGIIKKLTTKIGQLQQQLQQVKNTQSSQSSPKNKSKNNTIYNQAVSQQYSQNKKQNMIKALDKSLQLTQKKYIKLQTQMDSLNNQKKIIKQKLQKYQHRSQQLVGLLMKYYDDALFGNIQIKEQNYTIDLKSMRKKKVQEWTNDQVKIVIHILINQLTTLMNRKNLGLPLLNRNIINVHDDDDISKIKFPRISEHSAVVMPNVIESKKLKDLPVNVATKIVGSHVRQWGKTVHVNSVSSLTRKYKIVQKRQ